jgi:hypothetical protein
MQPKWYYKAIEEKQNDGAKNSQIAMLIFNPENIILANYILRKIDQIVSFEYVDDLLNRSMVLLLQHF